MPLIGGFYADETRPWSQQDICNWLPCGAEQNGTRSPILAKTPPGLSPLVEVGTRPVRGVYVCEGRLFAVLGTTLYQISSTYVAIPLGTISGVGQVRFSHNQITGGNELLVVNGSAGWVYNTVTATLTRITDEGYPGAIDAVFIDGYLVQIEPARRFAFHSELSDASSYNTLDRFTSEVSPDLMVAMAVSNNELLMFNESTAEFFENTGAAQQPFRSKRITMQKGCAGRYAVATMDNTVFWLGDDGVFYLLDGYSPRRISTRPIEQAIRGLNWAQAFAFVWEDAGHSVCYWTFPDGRTWGYDASQPPGFQWHRRASYGFNRWRLSCLTRWNRRWVGGDFQTGRLWELDWDYVLEGDQEFISEVTGPVIHDNQSRVKMPRLELVMDTGQPEVAVRTFPAQPTGPTISGEAPDGAAGTAYTFTYTTSAGDAAIVSVALVEGVLPEGVTLSSAGTLSGTPTEAGVFAITVRVTDSNGLWDELDDSIYFSEFTFVTAPDETIVAGVYASTSGTSWGTHHDTGLGASVAFLYGVNHRLFAFASGAANGRVSGDRGGTWGDLSGLPTTSKHGMTYAEHGGVGRYLIFMSSGASAYTSTDGAAFSPIAVESRTYYGAAAMGSAVVVMSSLSSLIRSTDGGQTFGAAFSNGVGQAELVVSTGTAFIALGDGLIIRSATGSSGSWVQVHTPAGTASGLAYGSGRIVALMGNGTTHYSVDDGLTWTAGGALASFSAGSGLHNHLAFGDGLFVAVGQVQEIHTSPDAAAWTQRQASADPPNFNSIVAVGYGT